MTVQEWIASRASGTPSALNERILRALGDDAALEASRTAELCLAAAARSLDALLAENRYGRDSALDLLTVDALTTYAFEHASEGADGDQLRALAERGTYLLGQLMAQRV